MKIAITSNGEKLDNMVNLKFGRTTGFIIYNLDDNSFVFLPNQQSSNASHGAGIATAQTIAERNVSAVITGHCGPKAFSVLSAAGISLYKTEECTIQEVISKFKKGELTSINEASKANPECNNNCKKSKNC